MNKFYVYVTRIEKNVPEEFEILKTNDLEEAKKEARKQQDICDRELKVSHNKEYIIEIRNYINNIEDEECNDFSYDTIEF
jgi:hypothetical protein